MTKEEKNKRIAEWLGEPEPDEKATLDCLQRRCYGSVQGLWTLHRTSGAPIEVVQSYYWMPGDFYRNESANALILEKLPEPMLIRDGDTWKCCQKDGSFSMDADRKTAICEAALRLISTPHASPTKDVAK